MSSSTKEQTEQEFVHEVQFFIGFCKSKITVEYLQKQANKATTKVRPK